jgi:hypothetical protein
VSNKPAIKDPFIENYSEKRIQFGVRTLLTAMAVFAVTSACFLFASQLPLVSKEIHAWMGTVPSKNTDGGDRFLQLIFLIICYSSPLLLAAVLNLFVVGIRYLEANQTTRQVESDKEWEME